MPDGAQPGRLDLAVIGAGVAGLAAAHGAVEAGRTVRVLERSQRVGGLVSTHREDGLVIEEGADGLLLSDPRVVELVERLGLWPELVRGGEAPRAALVATPEGLRPVPPGLFRFERKLALTMLASPVLSPVGKLRLFGEPFAPRATEPDESVSSFVTRRLGREVAEHLVDPMLRGVFGAPASELGVRGAMPALSRMETERGSLALGLLAARRATSGQGLVTLRRGMASLPDRLAAELSGRIALGTEVSELARGDGHWRLRTAKGDELAAGVVLACPAVEAARLLADASPAVAALLRRIETSRVDVVTLALEGPLRAAARGTGFVVQPRTGLSIAACTFSSDKWHGRAPAGRTLLRVTLDRPDLDEDAVIELARSEVERVVGEPIRPQLRRVRRIDRAIPVYGVGHLERVAAIRALARRELPGITFAGNAYDGVGVPNCLLSGLAAQRDAAPEVA